MKLLLSTIKTENPATQLALRYLYGIVVDSPLETTMKSYDNLDLDTAIYEDIVRGQYNIVYFHCDEYNEDRIMGIIEMIKKATPSVVALIGGMHVSFDTKQLMIDNPCVDFIIRGEGETVLFNYLKTMITFDYGFDSIAGLTYRENGEIMVNPLDAVLDMEQLPFPYEKTEMEDSKVVYYETIRGTADRSAYVQRMPDARVRSLPLNRICTELRYFLVKGVEKVVILDKYFNYNTERSYRILEYIINNDNGLITFELNMDGDNLDEETIRLLAEAREGLFVFNVDIASTNAETLATIGRSENVYQMMYNVTKLLQNKNIKCQISVMAGLPLETEELFARSFNKAYGLGEGTTLSVDILKLPRGSALRKEAGKFGYIYRNHAPFEILGNAFMPASSLINIRAIARLTSIYVNDEFNSSIAKILTDTGLKPYEMFSVFSEFLFNNKLDGKLVKKENQFRVLYKFASTLYEDFDDPLKLQIFKEVLHGDLEKTIPPDAVKKFERKGWEIEA